MNHLHIFSVIIFLLLFSCNNNSEEKTESTGQKPEVQNKNSSLVTLTEMEERESEIQTGTIGENEVKKNISCNGVIEVLPNYIVTVIPPFKGYIKDFYHETGDFVKKGAKLVRLSHPRFLKIQEEYLSIKSQSEYYKTEYERQGELAVEKAASLKKMQKAKADYSESQARLQSLKQKLKMINIDPEKIKEGELIPDICLYAPISGYITEMNSNIGKMADENNPVYEIMDMNHLRLRMNVPETEVAQLSKGQRVEYTLVTNGDKTYTSKITDIGNKVNKKERTLPVYADIQSPGKQFKHGLSVSAKIVVSIQHQYALPDEAIVDIEGAPHVFIKEENSYKPFRVKTGPQNGGYTVIENYDPLTSKEIVIEGSVYLKKKLF